MTGDPAVVLLSGGLDSTTVLAIACSEGYVRTRSVSATGSGPASNWTQPGRSPASASPGMDRARWAGCRVRRGRGVGGDLAGVQTDAADENSGGSGPPVRPVAWLPRPARRPSRSRRSSRLGDAVQQSQLRRNLLGPAAKTMRALCAARASC